MAYALADFNRACISGNVDAARQILAINTRMPPDQSSKGSALEWTGKSGTPEMKALFRKYLAMRVRRCVLGPASEHSRRQMARDLAPEIASFLV